MEISKINSTEQNGIDINLVTISEAVTSLNRAVSVLRSLEEEREDILSNQLNINFPEEGLDFYGTIRHLETSLIKQALCLTKGHQTRAAKLLNLNLSTLNSIIKRYKIDI